MIFFEKFIDDNNEVIKNIFTEKTSSGYEITGKVIEQYIDVIRHSLFDISNLCDVRLIYDSSIIRHHDAILTKVLSNDYWNKEGLKDSLNVCVKQQELINKYGIEYCKINNNNLFNVRNEINYKLKVLETISKLKDIETQISSLVKKEDDSIYRYDDVLALIDAYDTIVQENDLKNVSIPGFCSYDTICLRQDALLEQKKKATWILNKNENIISDYLEQKGNFSYDLAILACNSQEALLEEYKKRNWIIPELKYSERQNCKDLIDDKKEEISSIIKIKCIDNELNECINEAFNKNSMELCEKANELSDNLEKQLSVHMHNGYKPPKLICGTINAVKKRIISIKEEIKNKEEIISQIRLNDSKIRELTRLDMVNLEQCIYILDLCDQQEKSAEQLNNYQMFEEHNNINIEFVKKKYSLYKEIYEFDSVIKRISDPISTLANYTNYYIACKSLLALINQCRYANFLIPLVEDPEKKLNDAKQKWEQKKRRRIFKRIIQIAVPVLILFIVCFLLSRS